MPDKAIYLLTLAFATYFVPAQASELKQVATIAIPDAPLASFDISAIDQATQRLYLADRSNKGIDIFDLRTNAHVGRIGGFVGAVTDTAGKVSSNKSGPDGVIVIGDEIWAGDGDSTIKVIDAKTLKIIDTISTGGHSRLDEMAYDPKNQIFIGVNNAEHPPFATLISTKPGHHVIGKVTFDEATDGAEQPGYNEADGLFYVSIPEVNKSPKKGGVAVIDPAAAKLLRILPVDKCRPNGLAFGPDQNFVLGCSVRGKDEMPPIIVIMNAKSGQVVATVPDIGGADMVAYSKANNQYYVGGGNYPGGGVLGVIDAATNKLVQKIPMHGASTPHSVAVSEVSKQVAVPGGAGEGGCNCIQVLAPQ
jgi:DNA-binding beta-propeller fold protein YncE